MRDGSSEPGAAPTAPAAGNETTRTFAERQQRADGPAAPGARAPAEAVPPRAPTEAVPARTPTEVAGHDPGLPAAPTAGRAGPAPRPAGHSDLPPEIVRYGPGVPAVPPAGRAELTAAHVWHDTRQTRPSRRPARLGRLAGWALTVVLLAASGVLLYLRFHHAPFHVTHVAITQQAANGCGVDVTGRITTNGSAGTVSYQWLFRPGSQPPRPLSQSAVAGQRAVYVTVAVEGQGHGSASQTVILQVLGPDPGAASATVTVSCP